jgi:hypothetical protein
MKATYRGFLNDLLIKVAELRNNIFCVYTLILCRPFTLRDVIG